MCWFCKTCSPNLEETTLWDGVYCSSLLLVNIELKWVRFTKTFLVWLAFILPSRKTTFLRTLKDFHLNFVHLKNNWEPDLAFKSDYSWFATVDTRTAADVLSRAIWNKNKIAWNCWLVWRFVLLVDVQSPILVGFAAWFWFKDAGFCQFVSKNWICLADNLSSTWQLQNGKRLMAWFLFLEALLMFILTVEQKYKMKEKILFDSGK